MLRMRNIMLLVGTVMIVGLIGQTAAGSQSGINLYGKRYTNLDVDTILNSDRLVRNYVDCLLSRKPCSPEGKELKRLLPEALRTKCGKCSNHQKESALRVLKKLYSAYPDYYNDLREKWDPSGEYHRKFELYLQEEQFNSISAEPTRPDFYQTSSNNVNTPSISLPANIPSSTLRTTLETQRPARNPDGDQKTPADVTPVSFNNRFADDDDDLPPVPAAAAPIDQPSYLPPDSNIQTSSGSGGASPSAFATNPTTTTVTPTTLPPTPPTTKAVFRPHARPPVVGSPPIAATSDGDQQQQQPTTASSDRTSSVVAPNGGSPTVQATSPLNTPTRQPTVIQALFPNTQNNNNHNNNHNNGGGGAANMPFNPFLPPITGSVTITGDGPFGLGIIKRIGTKITNTAEFFAEMVRNTVKRP